MWDHGGSKAFTDKRLPSRYLLLAIVLLSCLLAIDQIATEGRYSRAAWREANDQARYVHNQVDRLVDFTRP
jgi:hypothetical protein